MASQNDPITPAPPTAPTLFINAKKESQSQPNDPHDFSQTREEENIGGLEEDDDHTRHRPERRRASGRHRDHDSDKDFDEEEDDTAHVDGPAPHEPTLPPGQRKGAAEEDDDEDNGHQRMKIDGPKQSESQSTGWNPADANELFKDSQAPPSAQPHQIRPTPNDTANSISRFRREKSDAPLPNLSHAKNTATEDHHPPARDANRTTTPTPADAPGFTWSNLQSQFEQEMAAKQQEEEAQQAEFEKLLQYHSVYAAAAISHDTSRAAKRLRTRAAYVQHAEAEVAAKREHHANVVRAFAGAMALLDGAAGAR